MPTHWSSRITFAAALLLATSLAPGSVVRSSRHASGQETPPRPVPVADCPGVTSRGWVVLPPVGRYGRAPVYTDALLLEIVSGRWRTPSAGDVVRLSDASVRR